MTNCPFGKKRGPVAMLVVAIAYFVMDMFFHHVVLGSLYEQTMSLWRPMTEIMEKRWVAYPGYLVFSFLFVCIFARGFEQGKCPKGQGIRYGLMIGLFYWGSQLLLGYPFHPWPDQLYLAWFGVGMVECVILGVIAGCLVKKQAS